MRSKWVQVPGAFILLVLAGWFIYAMIHAGPAVQSGILAIVGTFTAGILANNSAKNGKLKRDTSMRSERVTPAFVSTIIETLLAEKLGRNPPVHEAVAGKNYTIQKNAVDLGRCGRH